jgi:hypothetical protein
MPYYRLQYPGSPTVILGSVVVSSDLWRGAGEVASHRRRLAPVGSLASKRPPGRSISSSLILSLSWAWPRLAASKSSRSGDSTAIPPTYNSFPIRNAFTLSL